jgi:hypothetical protein
MARITSLRSDMFVQDGERFVLLPAESSSLTSALAGGLLAIMVTVSLGLVDAPFNLSVMIAAISALATMLLIDAVCRARRPRQPVVFDRSRNRVTIGARDVCAVTDVREVRSSGQIHGQVQVEPSAGTAKASPSASTVVVVPDTARYRAVSAAGALAEFLGVPLVCTVYTADGQPETLRYRSDSALWTGRGVRDVTGIVARSCRALLDGDRDARRIAAQVLAGCGDAEQVAREVAQAGGLSARERIGALKALAASSMQPLSAEMRAIADDLPAFCGRVLESPASDAEREGAQAILTELVSKVLLRPSSAPPEEAGKTLLRPAGGPPVGATEQLLRPGDAPEKR